MVLPLGEAGVEVVDISEGPAAARTHQIMAIATVEREWPLQPRRIIGDLPDEARLLVALGISPPGLQPIRAPANFMVGYRGSCRRSFPGGHSW